MRQELARGGEQLRDAARDDGVDEARLPLGQGRERVERARGGVAVHVPVEAVLQSPSSVVPRDATVKMGGSVGGVAGMLFALPVLLIVKTCLRVWAARRE